MKLKTLKEMQELTSSQKVLKMLLKQEAIKWIKKIEKNDGMIDTTFESIYIDGVGYIIDMSKLLKIFFNIKEEDLK